jgi:hypothetical protein
VPDAAAHEPYLFMAGRAPRDQPAAGHLVIARGQIKADHADGFPFPAKMITKPLVDVRVKVIDFREPDIVRVDIGVTAKQSSAGENSHNF